MKGIMKVITNNKQARFNYELVEKFEAGLSLLGWEVKSIRAGNVNLKNAFVAFKNNELFLINAHISLYMAVKGEENGSRKLLLNKREIKRLKEKQEQNGFTIVPTKLYWNNRNFVKIEIALARGKNKSDKRQTIKERDTLREMAREISKMGV
ncbi:SsrA-binding protein SmpB [Candidatus Mycoplasma pogonae]